MIGIFWNIRGLGQKGKLQCLSDLVNKYKPDFLGFQEIKRETLSDSFLNALASSIAYDWHMLPAVGSSGGSLWVLNLIFLRCLVLVIRIIVLS